MRIMNLISPSRKKVRGAKRKCKAIISLINEMTTIFPEVNMEHGYWNISLPASQAFIDSRKTPFKVRTLCMQTLIDRVKYLIENKPDIDVSARVVACITLPNLWHSQIIVFFGDEYFESFFNRDSEYQKWTRLPPSRSISREFNLNTSTGLAEKGYRQVIIDEVFNSTSELWFVGELS